MLNKKTGNLGEDLAKRYYQNIGYRVLKQNYYTRYGELDLVLEKDNQILVVEVKTRTNQKFGWAEESIDDKKLTNIENAYHILQSKQGFDPDYYLEICIVEIINNKVSLKTIQI